MKRLMVGFLIIIFPMLILAACSTGDDETNDSGQSITNENTGNDDGSNEVHNNENNTNNEEDNSDGEITAFDPEEEITLHFMAPWSEEQVKSRFQDEFEKEYPNITIEPIIEWPEKEELEKTYAKDIIPDVILVLGDFQELEEMDAVMPLDTLIENSDLDLDVYREGAIDAIRSRDPLGEDRLLGLPVEDIVFALFYNKEVFDLFGVQYPVDGMTWEDVVELVPKVTGERNGIDYVGLPTNSWSQAFQQLSVTGTDPETGEVLFVNQPEFAKYFKLIEDLITIPGNIVKDPDETEFKTGNIAMNLLTVSNIPNMSGEDSLDFDVVQFPSWEDNPNVMPNNLPLTLAINPHSEHKEAAFKLLEFIASEEQQINMAEAGVAPVVDDPEVVAHLAEGGADINIEGVYSGTPAEPAEYSKYGPDMLFYAENFLGTKTTEFLDLFRENKSVDINTFIREMEEEYEAILKEKEFK